MPTVTVPTPTCRPAGSDDDDTDTPVTRRRRRPSPPPPTTVPPASRLPPVGPRAHRPGSSRRTPPAPRDLTVERRRRPEDASSRAGTTLGFHRPPRAILARAAPSAHARATLARGDDETLRTANRVSVRLAFRLPYAGRRFLIVRGPPRRAGSRGISPSAGGRASTPSTSPVGCTAGDSTRRLPDLALADRRLVRGAATEYVRVVSPRRSVPLPDQARSLPAAGAGPR